MLDSEAEADMKTTYVDRPEVSEVYADGVKRVTFHEGAWHFEFTVTRMDDPVPGEEPTAKQYTSLRLTLAAPVGPNLCDNINGLMDLLERQGIMKRMTKPPASPSPGASH